MWTSGTEPQHTFTKFDFSIATIRRMDVETWGTEMTLLNLRLMRIPCRHSMFFFATNISRCKSAEHMMFMPNRTRVPLKIMAMIPKAIDNELILSGENGNGTGCALYTPLFARAQSSLECSSCRCPWRQRSCKLYNIFGMRVEIKFAVWRENKNTIWWTTRHRTDGWIRWNR